MSRENDIEDAIISAIDAAAPGFTVVEHYDSDAQARLDGGRIHYPAALVHIDHIDFNVADESGELIDAEPALVNIYVIAKSMRASGAAKENAYTLLDSLRGLLHNCALQINGFKALFLFDQTPLTVEKGMVVFRQRYQYHGNFNE